jgi:hypothetical protein
MDSRVRGNDKKYEYLPFYEINKVCGLNDIGVYVLLSKTRFDLRSVRGRLW